MNPKVNVVNVVNAITVVEAAATSEAEAPKETREATLRFPITLLHESFSAYHMCISRPDVV